MEANYKEPCDFNINRLGEEWHITGCWKIKHDNSPAWFDGETVRSGVKFHRIFSPGELYKLGCPEITMVVDGYKVNDQQDV